MGMHETTTRLVVLPSVTVDHSLREALQSLAKQNSRSIPEQVSAILEEYLLDHGLWERPVRGKPAESK